MAGGHEPRHLTRRRLRLMRAAVGAAAFLGLATFVGVSATRDGDGAATAAQAAIAPVEATDPAAGAVTTPPVDDGGFFGGEPAGEPVGASGAS